MPDMKQTDLKPCSACDKGVMHNRSPIFYVVRVDTMGVDANAVQRQHGLEMTLGGNAALAHVMGPQEVMAKEMSTRDLVLCLDCMMGCNVATLLPGGD